MTHSISVMGLVIHSPTTEDFMIRFGDPDITATASEALIITDILMPTTRGDGTLAGDSAGVAITVMDIDILHITPIIDITTTSHPITEET